MRELARKLYSNYKRKLCLSESCCYLAVELEGIRTLLKSPVRRIGKEVKGHKLHFSQVYSSNNIENYQLYSDNEVIKEFPVNPCVFRIENEEFSYLDDPQFSDPQQRHLFRLQDSVKQIKEEMSSSILELLQVLQDNESITNSNEVLSAKYEQLVLRKGEKADHKHSHKSVHITQNNTESVVYRIPINEDDEITINAESFYGDYTS